MLRKFCLSAIVVNLCVLDFDYIVETSLNVKLVSADCPMSLVSENTLSLSLVIDYFQILPTRLASCP